MIFFSVHNPVNVNMVGSTGYGNSDPSIPKILCLVPHILKGFDIQRQQAGILREGAEGTRDRKRAHTYALQLSQAREFHGAHTRTKMNCSAVHFEVSVPWPEKSL